jgi:hypothetical protein
MITPVMSYEANDGTLHKTREGAVDHNKWIMGVGLPEKISNVFRNCGPSEFYSLSESIMPFDRNQWWEEDIKYKREQFLDELASVIIDKWHQLDTIMKENK